MRRNSPIVVCLGAILLLGSPFAGQSAPDSGTKFSSSTELVLVPTVVTDNSGKHVPNLKKEDFVLKEDGKARTLSVFEEVTTDKSRLQRATGEKGQFSNFDPGEGPGVAGKFMDHRNPSAIERQQAHGLARFGGAGQEVDQPFARVGQIVKRSVDQVENDDGQPVTTLAGIEIAELSLLPGSALEARFVRRYLLKDGKRARFPIFLENEIFFVEIGNMVAGIVGDNRGDQDQFRGSREFGSAVGGGLPGKGGSEEQKHSEIHGNRGSATHARPRPGCQYKA